MKRYFAAILSLILFCLRAEAHPVSFKNGIGLMSYNSEMMSEFTANYSFSSRLAVAHTYWRDSESHFNIPRINYLVKRWNNPGSQGNIYVSAGSGIETYKSDTTSAHLGEIILDWENRQYYTYFEHVSIFRDQDRNPLHPYDVYNNSRLRLGFAPFLADYEDLNVWLIVQFQKNNRNDVDTTPLIRFYRKNVLWEIGASTEGNFVFNFMIHI